MDIREKIAEIKSRIDIVDVVSAVLSLKKAGRQWVALCPFHPDTKPSFYISPERQSYRCFGCGAAGDVISFVINYNHLSFKEAVTELAQRVGVELRWRSDEQRSRYSVLYELNETAANYYCKLLYEPEGKTALDYMLARGFERRNLEQFRIGYAPNDYRIVDFLLQKGFTRKDMVDAGVCMDYEGRVLPFLRNRVVFPITDASRRVLGFGGRTVSDGEEPKYLNTRETVLFKKSTCLYGIAEAKEEIRRRGEILVTEGYTDVIMAHQRSVRNVCAVLGTAFTLQHALVMKRYANRVILLFDSDTAGKKAATRSVDTLLSAGLDVRIAELPEGSDLCDYISAHSPEEVEGITKEARGFIEFLYDVCVKEYGDGVRGRKQTIDRIAEALSYIKSESERHLWAKEVAALMGLPPYVILRDSERGRRRLEERSEASPLNPRDADIVEMMLLEPDIVDDVRGHFSVDDIYDERLREVVAYIFRQTQETGTFDIEHLYNSESGELLRARVKDVLTRAERLSMDKEKRDYRKILDGWVAKKKAEERKRELWEAIKSSNDMDALEKFCKEIALKDGTLGDTDGGRREDID